MSDADRTPLLSLTTGLGSALAPVAFHAVEAISAPFAVEIEAVSSQSEIDPAGILFKPASLTVTHQGGTRIFHGLVRAIASGGLPRRGYYGYQVSVVPRLWFMAQTVDCRIFQEKTVGAILQALCQDVGQTLDLRIFGSQPVQDYVTQYNESDLHFASRLMEQAGYFYTFAHSSSDHVLVVTDRNQGLPAGDKPTLAVIHEGSNFDTLHDWRRRPATAWGSVTLQDYDPANPDTPPRATTATTFAHAGVERRPVMQWPALSLQGQTVADRSGFMMQAAEAQAALIDAAGSNPSFVPGARFTLLRDPSSGAGGVDYIVHSLRHQGSDDVWITGGRGGSYDNSLTVFPASVSWRQSLVTPRPVMAGVCAAVVLGNDGEEIHADHLGRVKVRLQWDHRADTVADKAVWARVVQPSAGNRWGWQHLPRVGTEVAVAFVDGDADRPIVLGGLYNGSMQPVFAVPAEQTKSGLRSRSTTGGGRANFSEFSIDDKTGAELFYLHAEKDLTTEVEHDQTLSVGNDRTICVAGQESTTIGKGRNTTIQDAGDALTVQSGDLTIQVSAGAVAIQAMSKIELTVGGNSIKIDPSGITLNGTLVNVQGESLVQIKAAMTQVTADGMMVMQGGIVTVN